ncbi:MAG: hypothetical protein AAF441_15900 [Pseudomonadota bacterium]
MTAVDQANIVAPSLVEGRPGLDKLLRCGVTVLDQAIVSGTRFATSVLVARYAGAQELGTYTLALSIFMILASIEHALVSGPYAVFSHRHEKEQKRRLAGSVVLHLTGLMLLIAFICGLVAAGTGAAALFLGSEFAGLSEFSWLCLLLGICLPLLLARSFARSFTLAHFDHAGVTYLDVVADGLILGGLLLLIGGGLLTGETALIAIGAGGAAASVVWFFRYRRELVFEMSAVKTDLHRHLRFGKWVVAAEILGTAQGYLVLWLLAGTRSVTETGIYAACLAIANLLNPVLIGLASYFTPHLARTFAAHGTGLLRRRSYLATGAMCAVVFAFLLFISLFGEETMRFVMADDIYSGQQSTLILLTLGLLFGSVGFGAETSLWIREQNRLSFIASAIAFTVTLTTGVYLVTEFGVAGAAAATLLGRAVFAVVSIGFDVHHTKRASAGRARSSELPGVAADRSSLPTSGSSLPPEEQR